MWRVIVIGILLFEVVSWLTYPYISIEDLLTISWRWMLVGTLAVVVTIVYYIAIFRYAYLSKNIWDAEVEVST